MKKFVISTAIAAVAAISCCSITSVAITKQEVTNRIEALKKSEYPDGKVQYEYRNNNGVVIGWSCHGEARAKSEDLWGSECQNGYGINWSRYNCTSATSFVNELRVGDVVRFNNGKYDHTITIVGFAGENIIYSDCNGYHDGDGANTIAWGQKISKYTLDAKLRKFLNDNPGQYGYICRYNGNPFSAWENMPSISDSSTGSYIPTVSYSSIVTTAQIEDMLFDAEIYRHLNPDVVKVYGTDAASLKKHWEKYGKTENRIASLLFDPEYYLAHNKDVANAFGRYNYAAAYNHFVQYGAFQGRQSSIFYHGNFFKDEHPDLQKAYGNDMPRYMRCFKLYTVYGNQWRNASAEFDVEAYRDNYQYLEDAYGDEAIRYFRHWLLYGSKEGLNPLPA